MTEYSNNFLHVSPESNPLHYCHVEEKWKPARLFHFLFGHDKTIRLISYEETRNMNLHYVPCAVCDTCKNRGVSLYTKFTRRIYRSTRKNIYARGMKIDNSGKLFQSRKSRTIKLEGNHDETFQLTIY